MGVFKTKEFAKFARKAKLADREMVIAAEAVASGLWDADLGGGVFKQRIAREGGGKSGGFRTIIAFKLGGHCFFVHGFAKNDKANVSPKALKALKALAATLNGFDEEALRRAGAAGEILEVLGDGEIGGED